MDTLTMQSFISIRKSTTTGEPYFRMYHDNVAYQAHSEDSARVVLQAVGKLDKTTLVQLQRKTLAGEPWTDLRLKFPLELEVRKDGDANGGAKFCTILKASRIKPMKLAIDLNGVETHVPKYAAAKKQTVAAEADDESVVF